MKTAMLLAATGLSGVVLGQLLAAARAPALPNVTLYQPVVTMVHVDGTMVTSPVSEGELSVRACMSWRPRAEAVAARAAEVARADFECQRIDVPHARAAAIAALREGGLARN